MKFVDVCCGGGGASLGAVSAGFEVALGVDVDVAALRVFKANFPLAKTSNLELPCDKKALKALFPAEAYHLHICAFHSEWSPTAREFGEPPLSQNHPLPPQPLFSQPCIVSATSCAIKDCSPHVR